MSVSLPILRACEQGGNATLSEYFFQYLLVALIISAVLAPWSFWLLLGLPCGRHLLSSGLVLCPELSLCVCVIYHCLLQPRLVWDTSPSLCLFNSFHFSESFQIYWLGPLGRSLITILPVRRSNVLKHELCFVDFLGLLLMFLIQPLIPKFVSCNCHLVCVCIHIWLCMCEYLWTWVPMSHALRFLTYPGILWLLHLNMSLGERNPAFPMWCPYRCHFCVLGRRYSHLP